MNALKSPVTENILSTGTEDAPPPALKMHLVWEKIWPKNLISGTLHNDVSNAVVKLDRKKGTNYGTGCLFFVILQCNFYRLVKI